MMDQKIRPLFQTLLLNGVAHRLQDRITPIQITVLSGITGICVLPALLTGHTGLAVVLLLISGYLDILDGTLARLTGHTTNWGSVLDIIMDRFVEWIVIMALWAVDPTSRSLVVILMLGSILLCVSSFLVVGIFNENQTEKSFYYSPGLMERPESFIFFIAMMLWPAAFTPLALLFTILVLFTAMIRLWQFYKQTTRG